MLSTSDNQVVMRRDDFHLLTNYFKNNSTTMATKNDYASLGEELSKAAVVEKEDFPADTVRLNSTAVIKDLKSGRVLSLTVVLPEQANIKQNKVSVLAPVGTALIGAKIGQQVSWKTPASTMNFSVIEVRQA